MIDKNFYKKLKSEITINELVSLLSANIENKKLFDIDDIKLTDVAPLDTALENNISFIHNEKYITILVQTKAKVILISNEIFHKLEDKKSKVFIICKDPYIAFSKLLLFFYDYKEFSLNHSNNSTILSKKISETATIFPGCYVGDNVEIGANTIIYPNTVIMDGVRIAENSIIGSGSYLQSAYIGKNAHIGPGCRIGSEGFGYTSDIKGHHKIKHFGRVLIGDNVSIGDNTVIHRGSIKDTIIEDGTKIDSLVHIAHNVTIGKNCFIAGQTGFAGSAAIGDYVAFGGQCGIQGHIKIGSNVRFSAKAGVTKNISNNSGDYYGMPAIPKKDWQKSQIMLRKLVKKGI